MKIAPLFCVIRRCGAERMSRAFVSSTIFHDNADRKVGLSPDGYNKKREHLSSIGYALVRE